MKTKLIYALVALSIAHVEMACAQTMDVEMAGLADKVGKALVAKGCKNVAAVDFTDIQGQPTVLGRFLSEQLTARIVATTNVSMLDQVQIKHILALQNLTVEATLDPENARKLRDSADVDTILEGTVSDIDDGIRLTVKAVSTSTNQIIAAGWITFTKTRTIQDIEHQSISSAAVSEVGESAAPGGVSSPNYVEDNPLATKDLGPLRVVLKSVAEVAPGGQRRGLQVLIEFTNRDTQNSIMVAINGQAQNQYSQAPVGLRTHVLDDQGGVWNLLPSGLYGIGSVRVGVHGRHGEDEYNPSEIGRLLQLRDGLGRDTDDPTDGFYANADSCGEGGCNSTFDSRYGNTSPRKFFPFSGNRFVSGSTTSIEYGQTASVTMNFVPQTSGPDYGPMISFQFQSEIVVCVLEAGMKRSYSLHNLTFNIASQPAH